MFPILSVGDLKQVDWTRVAFEPLQSSSSSSSKSSSSSLQILKRARDDITSNVSVSVDDAGYECDLGKCVSSQNPESQKIFLNTYPRFSDFVPHTASDETVKEKEEDEIREKITATQFYEKFVKKSQVECDNERLAKQGTKEWLQVRKLSLTASVFGAAAGSNPYQSPEDLLEEKLWGNFNGNALTAWGNDHEPHARESFLSWFEKYLRARYRKNNRTDEPIFNLKEDNAIKFEAEPWLAVSPDGILFFEDFDGTKKVSLVEFKCPTKDNVYKSESPYAKYEHGMPPYYRDQVQGICGYLNENKYSETYGTIDDIWFVVWRPAKLFVSHIKADSSYYETTLKPKLFNWYFKMYLPALTRKYNNNDKKECRHVIL
jgi:putative phage-type endonuclease